jgi:hypothetical protein
LKRVLLVLTVALMMAAMVLVLAVPAFAQGGSGGHLTVIPAGPFAGEEAGGGGGGSGDFGGGCGGGHGPNGKGGGGGNVCN